MVGGCLLGGLVPMGFVLEVGLKWMGGGPFGYHQVRVVVGDPMMSFVGRTPGVSGPRRGTP